VDFSILHSMVPLSLARRAMPGSQDWPMAQRCIMQTPRAAPLQLELGSKENLHVKECMRLSRLCTERIAIRRLGGSRPVSADRYGVQYI
jgi:hypothetical protein